eukprot:TRINITY_DN4548_c0_g2_i4.p1 TRINITY_DN4548_c0_g2~~TRINITY_DN4548_c0_g2_i4.p1  ORF type:complete len:333 (-),score=190.94 TRINITY_DN4548_c0_g2_i4:1014-2012(-)
MQKFERLKSKCGAKDVMKVLTKLESVLNGVDVIDDEEEEAPPIPEEEDEEEEEEKEQVNVEDFKRMRSESTARHMSQDEDSEEEEVPEPPSDDDDDVAPPPPEDDSEEEEEDDDDEEDALIDEKSLEIEMKHEILAARSASRMIRSRMESMVDEDDDEAPPPPPEDDEGDDVVLVNEELIDIQTILHGVHFLKYGKKGKPHTRLVWLDGAKEYVCWGKSEKEIGKEDAKNKISVSTMKVKAGRTTEIFKGNIKKKDPEQKDNWCFSIIGAERTLDLEVLAKTKEVRDYWVQYFKAIPETVGSASGSSSSGGGKKSKVSKMSKKNKKGKKGKK